MFALLLTQCIHATSEPSTQELAATVATQSSQISALVATVAQQAARISELEARMSTSVGSAPAEAREGRRLSSSPASQRTIWHGDALHAIDDPASCGLASELHSTTGPLTIRRKDDILSFGYSAGSPVFSISPPIKVVHSVGCNSTMNHMDSLTVAGSLDAGTLTVGGGTNLADRLDRIEAMLPPFPPVVLPNTADNSNPDWENEVKFMLKNERSGFCIAPDQNPPNNDNQVLTYNCDTATLTQWWFWQGSTLKNYGGHVNGQALCLTMFGFNEGDHIVVRSCDLSKSEHRWFWNNNLGNNNRQALINVYSYRGFRPDSTSEFASSRMYPSDGYNNADHRWSYFTG